MVVRSSKVFKKNLGMGEWALPWDGASSATPSRIIGHGYEGMGLGANDSRLG